MNLETLGIYLGLVPPETPPPARTPWLVMLVFVVGSAGTAAAILILFN
jgi:hypothetical protein